MVIIVVFAILSGVFQLGGYWFYIHKVITKNIQPNTASWSIWAVGAVLEASSYFFATDGDWLKNILPIVCSICAIIIFGICLFRGNFKRPDGFDLSIIVFDFFAIILWIATSSAVFTNLFLVFTAVISFIPILRHVWRNPWAENATPWWLWASAYAFLGLVVVLDFKKWEDLAYPIAYFVLHIIIAVLATDGMLKRKTYSLPSDTKETLIDAI